MSIRKLAQVRVSEVKLPAPSSYTLTRDGITQGLLADFCTCRQRFLFRVNGWTVDEDKDALYFGSLCHYVLEMYYRNKPKFPGIMLKRWIADYESKHPRDSAELFVKAEALLTVYFEVYREDLIKFSPVRTEEVFSVEALGARLRGRKDLIFRTKTKKLWMMEHKTKSRIDHDYLGYILSFDVQNLFYDLNEALIHKVNLDGILYNILRTPQIKPKKGENLVEYKKRLLAVIRKDHRDYFYRYEVTISTQDRERFLSETRRKIAEIRDYLAGKLSHYRNEAACVIPYKCKFLPACSSGFMTGFKKGPLFPELED